MADAKLIAKDDMHAHPPIWYDLWKADPMPVKVVLASFPKNTAHGQAFIVSMMHRDKVLTPVVDLSPVLNGGPFSHAYRREGLCEMDASLELNQRSVMVNHDYPSTMRALLSTSMHRPVGTLRLFVRTCGTGVKAGVCCQVEMEILMSLTWHNGPDCTLFAVRHYSLVAGDETDIDTLIDEMLAWLRTPELVVPAYVAPVQTYGAVACQELPECLENVAMNAINEQRRHHRGELCQLVSMIHAEPLEYCSPDKSGDHGVLFNIGVHWRRGAFADVGVKSETMIEYFQRERQSACGDYDVHRPGDAMDWLNGGEATVALESPSGDEELNVVGKDLSRCRSIAR